MEFQKLAENRYSCRQFSDRKVEPDLIMQIVEAANQAPTAVNKQPFKIFWAAFRRGKTAVAAGFPLYLWCGYISGGRVSYGRSLG